MNTPGKLAAYAGGLAVAFAVAFAAGGAADPITAADAKPDMNEMEQAGRGGAADDSDGHGDPEGTHGEGTTVAAALPGLSVSESGYTLVPERESLPAGAAVPFSFTVTGPGGEPVTEFVEAHEKELHLIVVRRDLTGFQHVHPVRDAAGTWRVPLDLRGPGVYRVFADFATPSVADGLTLGTDVFVRGPFAPVPLPEPDRTAQVGEYEVTLTGDAVAGAEPELTFTVTKDGRPVRDLQPYLGSFGHLVALRTGDLAYLHTHPGEDAHPGEQGGPAVAFVTEFPTPGRYRLFLDFQVGGQVRTAEFTMVAEATS